MKMDEIFRMNSTVEEVPGIYGTIKIDELVLQGIWAEQNFFTDNLLTNCGKKIIVLEPGSWNRSEEGPDFKNARLMIDGELMSGDIEIHLQPNDWDAHGHHLDLNYNSVVLHVCIFSMRPSAEIKNQKKQNGRSVPTLYLLPFLYCGLEEYAEAYVLAQLSGRGSSYGTSIDKLGNLTSQAIERHTFKRWESKLCFGKARLSRQDWSQACHQWFLEVLGYRRNRPPMARISQKYSILEWKSGAVEPEAAFRSQKDWKLRGCRPANHPRERLSQYSKLWRVNPNWISDLEKIINQLPREVKDMDLFRKDISKLSKYWRNSVLGGIFALSKANTLWIDFALPLLSARHNADNYELWKNWPCGDCPKIYREWAKLINKTDSKGKIFLSNGMVQCMISATSF